MLFERLKKMEEEIQELLERIEAAWRRNLESSEGGDRGRIRGLRRSTAVIVGIIAILVASSGLTLGLLTNSVNVPTSAVLAGVDLGIYTTEQCTANLTQISWGTVYPGSNYTRTGYIRNNGNVNMTLAMSTSKWSPDAASSVIGISWNYDGKAVKPGQVLAVTWTISIPSDISGIQDFSFDIVVTGSG